MTYAEAFEEVLTMLRERKAASHSVVSLTRAEAYNSKDPNLMFELGFLDALTSVVRDIERMKIDCDRCGGCGEQDASGAPCNACGGRGWNNPIEMEAA